MRIWVDADGCPNAIREILYRAAERTGLELILVANRALNVPPLKNIRALQVAGGFDVADNEIVARVADGDLVVTSDIPLAAEVLEKGAEAISFRGERYSRDTIGARLNMRDFMDTMRASGTQLGGGPPALGPRDRKAFAQHLDTVLGRYQRRSSDGRDD